MSKFQKKEDIYFYSAVVAIILIVVLSLISSASDTDLVGDGYKKITKLSKISKTTNDNDAGTFPTKIKTTNSEVTTQESLKYGRIGDANNDKVINTKDVDELARKILDQPKIVNFVDCMADVNKHINEYGETRYGDGIINVLDVIAIYDHINGKEILPEIYCQPCAVTSDCSSGVCSNGYCFGISGGIIGLGGGSGAGAGGAGGPGPGGIGRFCGDNILTVAIGEQCDDGNILNNDGCDQNCKLECGNGIINPNEQCDDGNTIINDGCDQNCKLECGNGIINPNEQCDDGNTINNDGCSDSCNLESKYDTTNYEDTIPECTNLIDDDGDGDIDCKDSGCLRTGVC
jgi:cysteine-rich repeat protein